MQHRTIWARGALAILLGTAAIALCACNKAVDPNHGGDGGAAGGDEAAGDAASGADDAAAERDGAADPADAAPTGGKTANPAGVGGGPPKPSLVWQEEPMAVDFPTGGWTLRFGQGMCMPQPACQGIRAEKGDEQRALTTRADVADVVLLLTDKEQALALVRFSTDHRHVFTDETCREVTVADDGTIDVRLPDDLDLEEPLTSTPVKLVDFEGGFRVERTLLCTGEEQDRLVQVAETVFIEGHWEREETAVLLEHEGLVPRLR